jgi:hypothetical protein
MVVASSYQMAFDDFKTHKGENGVRIHIEQKQREIVDCVVFSHFITWFDGSWHRCLGGFNPASIQQQFYAI